MPRLDEWSYAPIYQASSGNLIDDFYVPALNRSTSYDRGVGYFRSSIFHLVAVAVSDFAIRGGQIRIVCSPSLDPGDREVLNDRGIREDLIARDISWALSDPESLPVVELLATLLAHGSLRLRVCYPSANESGLFHPKLGIFGDGENFLSFEGSANETYAAWDSNEERFKTSCSWMDQRQLQLIEADQRYFESLWNNQLENWEVRELPDVPRATLLQYALPDPQEAVERVRIARRRRSIPAQRLRPLMPHQEAVRASWRLSRRGIIDHATGSGKTVTALAILRDWLLESRDHTAVVICPGEILLEQWADEMERAWPDLELRLLRVGSSKASRNWQSLVPDYTTPLMTSARRVVLATIDSAAGAIFRDRADTGDHTLVVVDEVHTAGSEYRSGVLTIRAGGRLGLSATPERFDDPEGTQKIFDYFGDRLRPSFGIREAQQCTPARLVQYQYHPDVVFLSAEEFQTYRDLGTRVAIAEARYRRGDSGITKEQLRLLKVQRVRVLKTAEAKPDHALTVLRGAYEVGQHWLVYCDDTAQLEAVRDRLLNAGLPTMFYTSEMHSSKPDTLLRFERSGGILLAIKCLDEGVDIPVVSHALFLSSSMNPREHIQRRGRVLRVAPNKPRAFLFDTLVGIEDDDGPKVFLSELERALSFARDAVDGRRRERYLQSLISYPSAGPHLVDDVEDDDAGIA